jgi:Rhodopirellula transposase DDE domain
VPYGVYDIASNAGWVSVGVDHDTAEFAVNSIRHCHSPYSCEHWERCTASKPADWAFYMPHLSAAPRRLELKALGVESISANPE